MKKTIWIIILVMNIQMLYAQIMYAEPKKEQYICGEDIRVIITLENNTDDDIVMPVYITYGTFQIKYKHVPKGVDINILEDPSYRRIVFELAPPRRIDKYRIRILSPSDRYTMSFSLERWTYLTYVEGIYEFSVIFKPRGVFLDDEDKEIVYEIPIESSNTVSIFLECDKD